MILISMSHNILTFQKKSEGHIYIYKMTFYFQSFVKIINHFISFTAFKKVFQHMTTGETVTGNV